jgi:hypothetical protein
MSTTAYDDQFVSDPEVPNPLPIFHHAVIPDALLEISRKLHSQDNRGTSHPIFQVRKLREIYNVEPDSADGWVWLDEEACLVTDQTLIGTLDKHVEEHGFDFEYEVTDNENETSYRRSYFRTIEIVVSDGAGFFTQQAAEAWIGANQKRHDEKLYVFVESGWRNPEWQQVRDFLLSLTLPVTLKE